MIDAGKLNEAREALGMSVKEGQAIPARAGGALLSGLKRLLLGAGIGGGLYGSYKAAPHIKSILQQISGKTPAETAFTPKERTQFARHGMDPEKLRFISQLASFRSGMNLQSALLRQALAGGPGAQAAPAETLGEYA